MNKLLFKVLDAMSKTPTVIKPPSRDSESGLVHRCCPSVRLSVCRQNPKKRDFLKN